jgi:hypothetical protein
VSEPKKRTHFNYKTRLQILAILLKDAIEKDTPEAIKKFEDVLHEHSQIFTDRD